MSEITKVAVDAMGGISTALVATTFVFMAVFIPVGFMGGTTGVFYTQFGLTMAVAVGISLLNSLTLSPALCALIMTPHEAVKPGEKASFSSRFHKAFDAGFGSIVNKYKHIVLFMFKRKWLTVILLIVAEGTEVTFTFTGCNVVGKKYVYTLFKIVLYKL